VARKHDGLEQTEYDTRQNGAEETAPMIEKVLPEVDDLFTTHVRKDERCDHVDAYRLQQADK
jgi:hypothetical protein